MSFRPNGEDIASVAVAAARELGTTYLLLGTPLRRGGIGRLLGRGPTSARGELDHVLLERLLDGLPGVDVRIVSDPLLRAPPSAPPRRG